MNRGETVIKPYLDLHAAEKKQNTLFHTKSKRTKQTLCARKCIMLITL